MEFFNLLKKQLEGENILVVLLTLAALVLLVMGIKALYKYLKKPKISMKTRGNYKDFNMNDQL